MKSEKTSDIPASSEGAAGPVTSRTSPVPGEPSPSLAGKVSTSLAAVAPASVRPVSSGRAPGRGAGRPPPATLDFALLRGALEEIPFGVATTRGGTVLYANDALTRLFGAAPGGLEQRLVAELFTPASFAEMSRGLEDQRVFDGRVRAVAEGGREVDVDVHVEWYSSESDGIGGFLVARDVSLELGALGRLVEQLGGAIFRMRVSEGTLEMVSPGIARLTGLEHVKCTQRPVLLTTLVSGEERERIAFLYRRMAKGELLSANAQVSLRRPDGVNRLVQLRATARRDATGTVRHIDGVVIDAARDPEGARASDRPPPPEVVGEPGARATMDLTYEMLRESAQHLNALFREIRSIRSTLKAHSALLPPDLAADLGMRLDGVAASAGAAGALNRGVRHALSNTSMGATLGEILDGVRATLGPAIGERVIHIDAGDASTFVLAERVDELTLALTHLSLRAFRFAGSGTLRITARRAKPEPRPVARGLSRPPEREAALVEILGEAPPDLAGAAMEISSDMLRTVPRPDEADLAYNAAQGIINSAGGTIEADDATFSTARSVVRLRG